MPRATHACLTDTAVRPVPIMSCRSVLVEMESAGMERLAGPEIFVADSRCLSDINACFRYDYNNIMKHVMKQIELVETEFVEMERPGNICC